MIKAKCPARVVPAACAFLPPRCVFKYHCFCFQKPVYAFPQLSDCFHYFYDCAIRCFVSRNNFLFMVVDGHGNFSRSNDIYRRILSSVSLFEPALQKSWWVDCFYWSDVPSHTDRKGKRSHYSSPLTTFIRAKLKRTFDR